MSSDPSLDLSTNESPNGVISAVTNFLQSGGSLGTLLQASLFGTIVSVFTGGINLIQSVFNLIVTPLDAAANAVSEFVSATVLEPLGLVSSTAETSAFAISQQFGPFAFIVGVGVLLGGFFLIIQFLEEEETPDFLAIPGFPDVPSIGPIDVGVEENGEDDN